MNDTSSPGTSAAPDDDEISLLDLMQVVADNLRLLILGPLLVGLTALGVSFAIAPTFTATVRFLPPQQQQSAAASMLANLGALGGLAGAASGLKNPSDQYLAFIESRTVQDALIDRFGLIDRYEAKLREDARKTLQAMARASSGSKDGLITVEVDDEDPKFAAQLANAHVAALKEMMGRIALENAKAQRSFLETQLEEAVRKPSQSPLVREAIIQGLIRQVEAARIDEARDGPVITQVDVAQPPELKSKPKKALIAVLATLATGFALLLFVFVRQALRNASSDGESAQKIAQIRSRLIFWR